jgi:hypothetical protein
MKSSDRPVARALLLAAGSILVISLLVTQAIGALPGLQKKAPFKNGSTYTNISWLTGTCTKGTGSGTAFAYLNNGTIWYSECAYAGYASTVKSSTIAGFNLSFKVAQNGTHSVSAKWSMSTTWGGENSKAFLHVFSRSNGTLVGSVLVSLKRSAGNTSVVWVGNLTAGRTYLASAYVLGDTFSTCSTFCFSGIQGGRHGSLVSLRVI